MSEFWHWNAPRLAAAFASREISPVEVVKGLLGRVAALDGKVNAFCLIDEPATLAQARSSEARWMKSAPLSPLDGVPVAVKDLLLTRGWPTLRGSRTIDPHQAWDQDSPAVARLRDWVRSCWARSPPPIMAGRA